MRTFENWELDDLETTFNLKSRFASPLMDHWLSATTEIDPVVGQQLEDLRQQIQVSSFSWNEDELKMFHIAPLLMLANYNHPPYKPFTQRSLKATVDEIEIGGVVDFMVALGNQKPKQPYFFVHEYKKLKLRDADPQAQLLSAMLAAQTNNHAEFPIYGSFIMGRFWFFVILDGKEYVQSRPFDAAQTEDIIQILAMLRKVNEYIQPIAEKERQKALAGLQK